MSTTRHSQPWVNKRAKNLSKRKQKTYNRARHTRVSTDMDEYKRLQKEQNYDCRKASHAYVSDMVTENPKKLYSFVKGKRMDGSEIYPLHADGMTLVKKPQS
ncbi:hypothetical protein DPMN_000586 [Dreissena polymorpha]|uniref:Uncharacterized protein n=1 Tax=Dreissena polymorpha TaxID=45954 RepID=A0A9D4RPM2_DREPO|nr:hypothetical protein DPMN_000586 [Dreissena polymorpha]